MAEKDRLHIVAFLAEEYLAADRAEQAGEGAAAWHHLERAHIAAQMHFRLHWQSHIKMLQMAGRDRDWREGIGQVARLFLVPLGHLTGRLPVGNTGRANVSAFAPMEMAQDLKSLLDPSQR